eukprot:gnl/MRDRNA2_/MRDRNA2_129051_c0_seq1.p1 gnl/MRDRNA2_/MRDRNA2_129051_c0~~gnl/MRDRNA2_/MRDRNA2_129051_c0_seq1.p1  ORF type:complete len:511 (-),score=91.51 gnl/MRDRNA2_/MRDRNA2_129051_c0_seq1:25-1557(-)
MHRLNGIDCIFSFTMHRCTMIVVLSLIAQTYAKGFMANPNNDAKHSSDKLTGKLVDKWVDKIVDQRLKASHLQGADLQNVALAKTFSNAIQSPQSRGPLFARPRPRSVLSPIFAQKQLPVMSRKDRLTFPPTPHSLSNSAGKFGFDPLGLKSALKPKPNDINELGRQLFVSALALAIALSPQSALADAPVSAFNKVDKTGLIGGVASLIENGIDAAHTGLEGSGMTANTYGISICLFTLLVRTITLPLTKIQLESSTKMQQIQPLQKKIQAAFPRKSQEQAKNQLMAQLFQAANVNPLVGCFPALVQIPVFISLYRALTNLVAEDKLQEGFLWLPSLEGPIYGGQTSNWFTSIAGGNPVLGWPDTLAYLSLPLILIVTQTAASKILQPPRDPSVAMTPSEQTTQNLVLFLPFLIALFSLNVPAGLSVYWVASNVLTTVITLAVKAGIKEDDLPPAVQRVMAEVESELSGGNDDPVPAMADGDMTDFEQAMRVKKQKRKKKQKNQGGKGRR